MAAGFELYQLITDGQAVNRHQKLTFNCAFTID